MGRWTSARISALALSGALLSGGAVAALGAAAGASTSAPSHCAKVAQREATIASRNSTAATHLTKLSSALGRAEAAGNSTKVSTIEQKITKVQAGQARRATKLASLQAACPTATA
jgi:hypothetical protein